jgi:hypothetical protein
LRDPRNTIVDRVDQIIFATGIATGRLMTREKENQTK